MSSLREKMPLTTAFIDSMRATFGEQEVNNAIRGGVAGRQTFWASEAGITVGTKYTGPYGVLPVAVTAKGGN